jgi:hypothetical protein
MFEKAKETAGSRKFWACCAALVATAGAYATGEVGAGEALAATVVALSTYIGGLAHVDAAKAKAKAE